jgi:hypothetical protein
MSTNATKVIIAHIGPNKYVIEWDDEGGSAHEVDGDDLLDTLDAFEGAAPLVVINGNTTRYADAAYRRFCESVERAIDETPDDDMSSYRGAAARLASDEQLAVRVELLNDDGIKRVEYGVGATADDAVHDAERKAAEATGDDSYVMNEWGAA